MQISHMNYSNYRCVACNVHFNNFDEQKQHYFSFHSRSVDQGQFTKNLYSSYRQLSTTPKKVVPMRCDICNISCSSQCAYDYHIKGRKHTKALNKIALTKTDSILADNSFTGDVKPNDSNSAIVPVIQQSQILYKPNLMCDICQVNCLQLDQLQKHLEGSKHQKKMKLNRFVELKSKKDASVYCDICDVYMNEELMEKHRQSGKHKRKNSDKTTAETAAKKAKTTDIPTSVEQCGYCHITLKTPELAVEHYQTPKHALNVINRSRNYELWCDLCQISFANKQFQELHMNGFRHYVRANRGNTSPEGPFSERLLKMREKMKGLHSNKRKKAFSYTDKYKFVPNESPATATATATDDTVVAKPEEIVAPTVEVTVVEVMETVDTMDGVAATVPVDSQQTPPPVVVNQRQIWATRAKGKV